jgi:hypothetical protein
VRATVGRLLSGFGDSTCDGTALREAARVLRVAAGLAGATVFARFLGTLSSSFSLSPSSEGRFFPRVVFGAGFEAGFGASFFAAGAGAVRVLRVAAVGAVGRVGTGVGAGADAMAGAGAATGAGTTCFFAGTALTGLAAGSAASRRSMSFMLRLLAGMRLTRRSRRDRRLATWASHMA